MSDALEERFLAMAASGDSMASADALRKLYTYAKEAALRNNGVIVEIGAYRGASTMALAMAVRDAGHGSVYSIDPHLPTTGILGGRFTRADHDKYIETLDKHDLSRFVTHMCTDSSTAAIGWQTGIDMLWVDGDHSYEGVKADLLHWLPNMQPDAVLLMDDFSRGSEVEAAARDYLPYAFYKPLEKFGNTLALQHLPHGRRMYLCAGMQSSGSSLLSWCFLQHPWLDGVYDMDNALIQQDFSRTRTDSIWVKATIGAFRLKELVDVYSSQGWCVTPLLITRNLDVVLDSLAKKEYGVNGVTGDDPPLAVRASRYMEDVAHANAKGWPTIDFTEFVDDPIPRLAATCMRLGLPWNDALVHWSKPSSEISYMSPGNANFDRTRQQHNNLPDALASYAQREPTPPEPSSSRDMKIPIYRGTRRQRFDVALSRMKGERRRLRQHTLFGPLLRFWRRWINRNLPDLGEDA